MLKCRVCTHKLRKVDQYDLLCKHCTEQCLMWANKSGIFFTDMVELDDPSLKGLDSVAPEWWRSSQWLVTIDQYISVGAPSEK